jgi:hypothetical protein
MAVEAKGYGGIRIVSRCVDDDDDGTGVGDVELAGKETVRDMALGKGRWVADSNSSHLAGYLGWGNFTLTKNARPRTVVVSFTTLGMVHLLLHPGQTCLHADLLLVRIPTTCLHLKGHWTR